MPIDGSPILDVVISQLKILGFNHITLAVGHMSDMIKMYFGDGEKFGVKIDYSYEDEPLGTVGALSLIQDLPEDFLVMNGDILTDLSFDRFFEFHKENGACTSIATYSKQVRIDYGIVESNPGDEIIGYNEKPSLKYHVSMGIYAFNYSVHKYIKKGQYFDFPDLVKLLIKKRERVMSFPFDGYWKDIGCHDDFVAAAEDFSSMKEKFIKESSTPPDRKKSSREA
jgi:NDP-sugar pyrophosphorylase family protein